MRITVLIGICVALVSTVPVEAVDLIFADGFETGDVSAWSVAVSHGQPGDVCSAAWQCDLGFCVDEVCCNEGCGSGSVTDCLACSLAAGSSADGFCDVVEDGMWCDDGLFCTGADTCSQGACLGSGDPCPGPDGDADCAESCDEVSDSCSAIDPNGAPCLDDGLFCTGMETCQGGFCVGSGDPCPGADGDVDCAESCDEISDTCSGFDPPGAPCSDGLFCNGTETCNAGLCGNSSGDPCPGADGDENCAESCDELSDTCSADDPDGSPCPGGLCVGGACIPDFHPLE